MKNCKLKNIIKLFLFFLILFNPPAFGDDFLSCVEKNLFNQSFPKENNEIRVERIEKRMFGRAFPAGPLDKRIIGLSKYWSSCKVTSSNPGGNSASPSVNIPVGDYPVVDEMEKKLLGTVYKNENIYKRLERLEFRLFNHSYQDSLADRVERLRNKTLSEVTNSGNEDDENLKNRISSLENNLLGRNFFDDTAETRISRLEEQVFGNSDDNYSEEERIIRLEAYADADDTGSYFASQSAQMQNNSTTTSVQLIEILFYIIQALFL